MKSRPRSAAVKIMRGGEVVFQFLSQQKTSEKKLPLEQLYAIKFCFPVDKSTSETLVLIEEAYKNDTLLLVKVCRECREFENGRETLEDMERSGRPLTQSQRIFTSRTNCQRLFPVFYKEALARLHRTVKRK